jgi:hypothetical protein
MPTHPSPLGRDHWSSPPHKEERRFLIEQLQMIAKARSMRVTFISGDVHLAAAARLYTWPKMDAPDVKQQQEAPARHTLNLHPLRSQNLSREDAVVVGEVVGTPEWEHLEGGRVGDGSDAGSDTGVSPGGGYGRGTSSVRSGWAASTAGATVGASSRQESLDSEAGASSSSSSAAGRVGAAPAAGFGVAGARGAAAGRLTHSGRHSGATRAQDDASSSVSSASTAPDQKWHRRWSGFGRRMGSPGRGRHGWGGLLRDHRFMTQVVSSAIVNAPPPDILVKVGHTLHDRPQSVIQIHRVQDMGICLAWGWLLQRHRVATCMHVPPAAVCFVPGSGVRARAMQP